MNQLGVTTILMFVGISWGLTAPLSKIAVSTGHHYLGLLVWQIIVMTISLGLLQVTRRKRLALNLSSFWRYFDDISKKKYFDNLFLAASTSNNLALKSIHDQTVNMMNQLYGDKEGENP